MRRDETILEHSAPLLTMDENPTIYAEIPIPSFLTARPSGDLIEAARRCSEGMKMKADSIVTEVRRIRRNILESYGRYFDIVSCDVMKRQFESGHKVVTLSGKKIVEAAKPRVAETGAECRAKE